MNWRRGFLRLYAVTTVAWISVVGWLEWGLIAEVFYLDPICWRGPHGGLRVKCGPALLQESNWAASFVRIFAPPVLLFASGLAGAWVARGFRQPV
jgi:hypothetical protein